MILTFGVGRICEPLTILFQPFVEIVGTSAMCVNVFELSDI